MPDKYEIAEMMSAHLFMLFDEYDMYGENKYYLIESYFNTFINDLFERLKSESNEGADNA